MICPSLDLGCFCNTNLTPLRYWVSHVIIKSDFSWQWLESGKTWPVRKFLPATLTSELHLYVAFRLLVLSLSPAVLTFTWYMHCTMHRYQLIKVEYEMRFQAGAKATLIMDAITNSGNRCFVQTLSTFQHLFVITEGIHLIWFDFKVCVKTAAFRWGHHWGGLETISFDWTQEKVVWRIKSRLNELKGQCNEMFGRRLYLGTYCHLP